MARKVKVVETKKKRRIKVVRDRSYTRPSKGPYSNLSLEEVERMFDLYCRDMSAVKIAKIMWVDRGVVLKYIKRGDPQRGIEPFEIRRAQVIRAALLMQSGKVTQRMAQRAASLMETFKVVNSRFLSRIVAAAQLDDTGLWTDPRRTLELEILQRKALEPTASDLVAATRLGAEIDRLALEMEGKYAPPSGVVVNVNQQQAQQAGASSSVETKDMEMVYEHIKTLGKATDQDRAEISATVKKISIPLMAAAEAEEVRGSPRDPLASLPTPTLPHHNKESD